MGAGAHLVGHSYGAVVAMLAAASRPRAVRSLALIEPSAHRVAGRDPVVAAALERMRSAVARAPAMAPEEWLRASTEAAGMAPFEATPERLRAAATAMRERPC
jgi:pimeloyl-ACP methyl ester carboxylesterase